MSTAGKLEGLWKRVERTHKKHFPESKLRPIFGAGKIDRPEVMFVFINPTARNESAHQSWEGPRFPFIGTKQVWRVFARAGWFDKGLLGEIERAPSWSLELARKVQDYLDKEEMYLTNIVKWTGEDATLPGSKMIKLFLPLLIDEIRLVRPKRIVCFGLIPFRYLAGRELRLKEYFAQVTEQGRLVSFPSVPDELEVYPCYFPVGRGNPRRAVKILELLRGQVEVT